MINFLRPKLITRWEKIFSLTFVSGINGYEKIFLADFDTISNK